MAIEAAEEQPVSFRVFLESTPPGKYSKISDLGGKKSYEPNGTTLAALALPEITLHCDTESTCGGDRVFRTTYVKALHKGESHEAFVHYICKNCSANRKIFALWLDLGDDWKVGRAFKYGELPQFGPPTPARVITLIGPQKDLYLKGRRAENQGMGIAAFAYYRRVIEDQKNRIFDEIIRVCRGISAEKSFVEELTLAKSETQFTKAVEIVKHGIPQALLINGHNPLTLLHSALSEGLHAQTDEECLEVATSIRIVMAEFAERMGQALKDEAELNTAVSRLLSKKVVATKTPTADAVPAVSAADVSKRNSA